MRVLVWLPYALDRAPSQRFRIEQWIPWLEREGISCDVECFASPALQEALHARGGTLARVLGTLGGHLRRLRRVLSRGEHDVVFLHREATILGPAWSERLLGIPFVYDFDDAIYLPQEGGNPVARWLRMPGKTASLCRRAAEVIVGNEHLAGYARRFARRVSIVPTTIDTDLFRPPEQRKPPVIVGWSGSFSSGKYLEALRPVFDELHRRHPAARFRVIGASFEARGLPVEVLPWRAASEVADLLPIDIGLMPLPDDDWARGKCALKALVYMSLEAPAVVSPVGANVEAVTDGVDGFHAATTEQWVDRVGRLIDDAALRARMGAAARRTIEERYAAAVMGPRVAEVLRRAATAPRRRAS